MCFDFLFLLGALLLGFGRRLAALLARLAVRVRLAAAAAGAEYPARLAALGRVPRLLAAPDRLAVRVRRLSDARRRRLFVVVALLGQQRLEVAGL